MPCDTGDWTRIALWAAVPTGKDTADFLLALGHERIVVILKHQEERKQPPGMQETARETPSTTSTSSMQLLCRIAGTPSEDERVSALCLCPHSTDVHGWLYVCGMVSFA